MRWILFLCFIFLAGYAAPAYQHATRYTAQKVFALPVQDGLFDIQSNEALIFKANPPGTKQGRNRAKAIVIEEDEESSTSRKHAEASSPCITFYNSLTHLYISHDLNGRLPSCEHFSYIASCKFIMHRVIRI